MASTLIYGFWISFAVLFYSYLGYGIILYGLVRIKRAFYGRQNSYSQTPDPLPVVTVLIAAFNEQDYIIEKIQNTLSLNYPADRLKILVVTDGSSDQTPELVR